MSYPALPPVNGPANGGTVLPFPERSYDGAFWREDKSLIWYNEGFHKDFKDWLVKQHDYYLGLLEPVFQQCVDRWSRYLLKREDPRLETERWRAFITSPRPYQIIETNTQSMVEIFATADPLVQYQPVGPEDRTDAEAIERYVDMVLQQNAFPLFLDDLFRHVLVQGFQPVKVIWGQKNTWVRHVVTEKDYEAFERAVREAEMATGVDAPTMDPDAFDEWRKIVGTATQGRFQIPPIPVPGVEKRVLYEGPLLQRPSLYSLRFDPAIADFQQQDLIMQRYVVPRKLIEDMTDWSGTSRGPGDPTKPFCGPMVEKALYSYKPSMLGDWEARIAKMLGYQPDSAENPALQDPMELFECQLPNGTEVKHAYLLNREFCINKQPEYLPFEHGMVTYANIRNVPVEGALGISELEPSWSSFTEHERLKELFLDAALIEAIPIMLRMSTGGIDDEDLLGWYPGKTYTVNRPDALKMLSKDNRSGIDAVLKAMGFLRAEQDDTHSTWTNVMGASADVGRVTATDSERRLGQALLRHKARVARMSEEFKPIIYQILGLAAQFAGDEDLRNVGGVNPFAHVDRERFYLSMFQNFKLRGPMDHLRRTEQADALMAFAKTFGPFLRPEETRTLMDSVLHNLGIREVENIVTQKGTQETVMAMGGIPGPAQGPLGPDGQPIGPEAGGPPPGAPPPGPPQP